jgi:hypothetical protein
VAQAAHIVVHKAAAAAIAAIVALFLRESGLSIDPPFKR